MDEVAQVIIRSWQGWVTEPSMTPTSDYDHDETEPDGFYSYPLYLGGYGYGKHPFTIGDHNRLHCYVKIEFDTGSGMLNTYLSDSASYA